MIINNQHTVTIAQSVVRLVRCEECDTEFVYQMTREGEGHGNSLYFLDESGAKKRATAGARKELKKTMRSACDAVPCPECAHYQDHMLGQAKKDKARLPFVLGLAVGGGIALLGFILLLMRFGVIAVAVMLLGLLLLAVGCGTGAVIYSTFDPNRVPKKQRYAIADEKASGRTEFERAFADAAGEDYEKLRKKIARGKAADPTIEQAVWADRRQIADRGELPVRLATGEERAIELESDMRDGEEFTFKRDVDGTPVRLVCKLHVYTETRR